MKFLYNNGAFVGVETLGTRDSSDPRHFGTSDALSAVKPLCNVNEGRTSNATRYTGGIRLHKDKQ